MKLKSIMLAAFLLLAVLTIASASAADNATDEALSEITTDDDTISSQEEIEIIAADDGTFTSLQNKINNGGSTISLDRDYTYDEGFDVNGIKISKSVTINGNGHTLNGLSKSRIFKVEYSTASVDEHYTITLNNIKFVNGCTDSCSDHSGGAILATCDVKEVRGIDPNTGYTKMFYYNKYCSFKISNCAFTNNYAYNYGGAIHSPETQYARNSLEIDNCVFSKNRVEFDGGAINARGIFIMTNSQLNGNSAKYGGAIAVGGTSTVDGCTFAENSAKYGGAIYSTTGLVSNLDYSLTVTNTKFIKNTPKGESGAVYNSGAKCTITGSVCLDDYPSSGTAQAKSAGKAGAKTTLSLKKVTVKKSAKKLAITATLKIDGKAAKGKTITFKFNSKKYSAKTNAKGIAKITVKKSVLKKLKVGKKVKYQASYGKTTVKKTVKVKK